MISSDTPPSKTSLTIKYVVDDTETAKNIDLSKDLALQEEEIKVWIGDDWNGCLKFHEDMESTIDFKDSGTDDTYLFFDSIKYHDFPHPLVKFGCACNTELLKVTVKESRIQKNLSVIRGMLLNSLKLRAKVTLSDSYVVEPIKVYTSKLFESVGLNSLDSIRKELYRLSRFGIIPDTDNLNSRVEMVDELKTHFPNNTDNVLKSRRSNYYDTTPKESLENLGLLDANPSTTKWLHSLESFLQLKLSWLKTFNLEGQITTYTNISLFSDGRYGGLAHKTYNQIILASALEYLSHDTKLDRPLNEYVAANTDALCRHPYALSIFNIFCNTNRILEGISLFKLEEIAKDLQGCIRNFKTSTSSRKIDSIAGLVKESDRQGGSLGIYSFSPIEVRRLFINKLVDLKCIDKSTKRALTSLLRDKPPESINPYFLGLPETPEVSYLLENTFGIDLPNWAKPSKLIPVLKTCLDIAKNQECPDFLIYRTTDAGIRLKRHINL
jgi:hypothetical protein